MSKIRLNKNFSSNAESNNSDAEQTKSGYCIREYHGNNCNTESDEAHENEN